MTVYEATTYDELQLPLAVFDTEEELAEFMDTSVDRVRYYLSRRKGCRKVTWDDNADLFKPARYMKWRQVHHEEYLRRAREYARKKKEANGD